MQTLWGCLWWFSLINSWVFSCFGGFVVVLGLIVGLLLLIYLVFWCLLVVVFFVDLVVFVCFELLYLMLDVWLCSTLIIWLYCIAVTYLVSLGNIMICMCCLVVCLFITLITVGFSACWWGLFCVGFGCLLVDWLVGDFVVHWFVPFLVVCGLLIVVVATCFYFVVGLFLDLFVWIVTFRVV